MITYGVLYIWLLSKGKYSLKTKKLISFFFLSPDDIAGHNDWQYKVASAFMIAHDYGFKRVMSSYYFSNTDQVPQNNCKCGEKVPGSSPACPTLILRCAAGSLCNVEKETYPWSRKGEKKILHEMSSQKMGVIINNHPPNKKHSHFNFFSFFLTLLF